MASTAPERGLAAASSAGAVLQADRVNVVLGSQQILFDVSLSVAPGEAVALLGANGSGKSTLVRALLGIVPITSGTVRLLGEPLGKNAPWSRIGYVPQRIPPSTGIPTTASEVVRAGLISRGRRRLGSREQALAALQTMGMADRADQPVQQMSGGQQQRVLIARALIRNPELLLLDEPTSGIDLDTVETFVRTLDTLRQSGTGVVVVLHETEAFAPVLDRAAVLRHGRVIHDGALPPARGEHASPDHVHDHDHGTPEPASEQFSWDGIGETR